MLQTMSFKYKKINNNILKLPLGVLICKNCNYYYVVDENNYCYEYKNYNNRSKFICQFCRDNNDIYENLNIYSVDSISVSEINKIRQELILRNVINIWKKYHEKFKLLKKIIRHWIFMKKVYLNPYNEIGIIRLKLVQIKWDKINKSI